MNLTNLLAIAFILIVFIVILIIAAINQIQNAGINIKDFWSFIEANENLDKLYEFAQKYNKMSPEEQVIYLAEAERMFDAFDKVPSVVWEDEHDKYSKVLETYKDIRIMRWNESQGTSIFTEVKAKNKIELEDINGKYGKEKIKKKRKNSEAKKDKIIDGKVNEKNKSKNKNEGKANKKVNES